MVGGGSRRDEGSLVFWAPTPLNSKSWADVDDDDANTAPLQSVCGAWESQQSKENNVEDSETEEDVLDEGDDEGEEEHEHEPEVSMHPEPEVSKPTEVNVAPKEAERQLSKKERKKKELSELEALLADFGVTQKESNGVPQEKKDANGEKESAAAGSKNAKKKKKKDKAAKEVKESQDQPNNADASNGPDVGEGSEQADEDSSAVDVKEHLKKVTSIKKKKSSKEMDAAARASAAQEAAARSARLAAAKKKVKNHYNQQPVR
ncbi:stress response protein NST1-like [Quillaja saponaria]|uniref:Stress response protein NST1-like n=1 Tax=Quillaja saponaria TaxID=32244 RepID=A0AAD7LXD5_QUISA|nr:stress response protein NST1-like [Quillaja saponaria]